jgi:hypothetical protein
VACCKDCVERVLDYFKGASAPLRDSAILAREYPMLLRGPYSAMLECNLTFYNEAYKVSWWTLVFREDIIV